MSIKKLVGALLVINLLQFAVGVIILTVLGKPIFHAAGIISTCPWA